jgi:uncharacterized membrane protein YdjX (TVP38/TMEM64 family)
MSTEGLSLKKYGFLAVIVTAGLSIAPLLFNQTALTQALRCCGGWGVLLFLIAHLMATAIAIPGTVLVIAGGAVFGVVWGTVWSVLGATLGAIAAFGLARSFWRDRFVKRFSQHRLLQKLNCMVRRNSLSCVLTVRFAPISPFNLVNYLFGLTPIGLKPYAIGTFVGIIPGTAIYSWVGSSGARALQGESWMPLVIAMSLLGLLSAVPLLCRGRI